MEQERQKRKIGEQKGEKENGRERKSMTGRRRRDKNIDRGREAGGEGREIGEGEREKEERESVERQRGKREKRGRKVRERGEREGRQRRERGREGRERGRVGIANRFKREKRIQTTSEQ